MYNSANIFRDLFRIKFWITCIVVTYSPSLYAVPSKAVLHCLAWNFAGVEWKEWAHFLLRIGDRISVHVRSTKKPFSLILFCFSKFERFSRSSPFAYTDPVKCITCAVWWAASYYPTFAPLGRWWSAYQPMIPRRLPSGSWFAHFYSLFYSWL